MKRGAALDIFQYMMCIDSDVDRVKILTRDKNRGRVSLELFLFIEFELEGTRKVENIESKKHELHMTTEQRLYLM